MSYKAIILGCGGRAKDHARVYPRIAEIDLVAACDKNRQRLTTFGKEFNISNLYDDYEQMLEKEKPDIVDAITQPDFRIGTVEIAARHNVKAAILEKPVVMMPSEAERMLNISQSTGIRIIVNMQRRYNKDLQNLKEVISTGGIGDIVFGRCVSQGNMMCWGPHLIDLLLMFMGDVLPLDVWATVYGCEDLDPPYGIHPAPANLMANYTFPNEVEVFFETAKEAIGVKGVDSFWDHAEIDFWGTEGRAWWTHSRGGGYQSSGMSAPRIFQTGWASDEPIQQADFTKAVATWLDDDSTPHENRLEKALLGFDALMGAVKSALLDRRVSLPAKITDEEVREIWNRVKDREKDISPGG